LCEILGESSLCNNLGTKLFQYEAISRSQSSFSGYIYDLLLATLSSFKICLIHDLLLSAALDCVDVENDTSRKGKVRGELGEYQPELGYVSDS